MRGRGRFGDVVSRQLDVFASDETDLLAEAAEADAAWTNAGRDEAEGLYGDYQLVVDELAERLVDLRDAYASTLDETTAEEYREVFRRAARKRFRPYTSLLEDG